MTYENFQPPLWEQFEGGLKQEAPLAGVDFSKVEKRLMTQVGKARHLGILAPLKSHDIPKDLDWEGFERSLFARITEHEQYDKPVAEAISTHESLPEYQWERLEAKIYDNMEAVDHLEHWERVVKSEAYLPMGKWEPLEGKLMKRLSGISEKEPWDYLLKANLSAASTPEDMADEKLSSAMDTVDTMEVWERALKKEEILPEQHYKDIESKVMYRVKQYEALELSRVPFLWLSLGWFSRLNNAAVKVAVLALAAAAGWFGWQHYESAPKDMATLVYKAKGPSVPSFKKAYYPGHRVVAPEGNAVTLVNKRGYVELKNGSGMAIVAANKKQVTYKMEKNADASERTSTGVASFFVSKAKEQQSFRVQTPDYDIEVTGTYFKVQPDPGGKFSTQVLEGKVKVHLPGQEAVEVTAGQSVGFDYESGSFTVRNGGAVLYRYEIESLPELQDLENYRPLRITTNVPRAEVSLNGMYAGESPISLLQAPGRYGVRISGDGYQTLDTVVTLLNGEDQAFHFNLVKRTVKPLPETPLAVKQKNSLKPKEEAEEPVSKKSFADSAQSLLNQAKGWETEDWKKAVALYREIFQNTSANRLDRENALFNIARLNATHLKDKQVAITEFLNYLAMYPGGLFAGESWLRLAELELDRSPAKAIEYYLKYIKKFPSHHRVPGLQYRVGLIYLQLKNYTAAINMFEESLASMLPDQEKMRQNVFRNYHKALVAKGEVQKAEKVRELLEEPVK